MEETVGIITLVQEGRFKLADDVGRTKLFVLSHSAAIEPQDLLAILKRGERVTVKFENWENQIAAIAKDIFAVGATSMSDAKSRKSER